MLNLNPDACRLTGPLSSIPAWMSASILCTTNVG